MEHSEFACKKKQMC